MKTWKWLSIGLGVGVIGLAAAGNALAHGKHGAMFMQHMIESRVEDAEDYVDATPQQRQAIDQSVKTITASFKARMESHKELHDQLIDTLAADQLDTSKLYALADQRADDIRAMAKVIVPEIQKIHDVLTPAQRQKLAEKARKHRSE